MDLEKLNGDYLKLKQDIEIKKGVIVAYEHMVQDLTLDKIIWTGKKTEAQKTFDYDAEKTAQDELNKIDGKIKQLQESVEQEKETIKEFQGKIDAKITEIKENPEMKKHLDTVLKKKYERKLAKVEKEKEELIGKKDKVEQIKKLTTEHPALAMNLKGMISAYKTAESLKKELESLSFTTSDGKTICTNTTRVNEITTKLLPEAESKMEKNKTPFMDYIQKNKLDITEKDVNELVEKGAVNKDGKVDLETTFVKRTSGLNRQIKGLDKSIKDYTYAIGGAENRQQSPEQQGSAQEQEETGSFQFVKRFKNWSDRQNQPEEEQEDDQDKEEKPKWFQFIKRFKAWKERRNQQELPEGTSEGTPKGQPKKEKGSKNEFADSLKYDIMQDVTKQMQQDKLKAAKEARKENNEPER